MLIDITDIRTNQGGSLNPVICQLRVYLVEDMSMSGKEFKGTGDVQDQQWEELDNNGLIYYTENGIPRKKQYLDDMKGKDVQSLWDDIQPVVSWSTEQTSYPTQKPVRLIERIIKASSNPGDLVFDCFMGSGTTQAVAMKLGRRFIGADINLGAIQTTTKRLIGVAAELQQKQAEAAGKLDLKTEEEKKKELIDTWYTGF